MIRRMIRIDEEKCIGCGLCVNACQEGAIALIDGKAKLIRDDYCDGLGNCLPVCPTDAISFEEREALPFNEKAVAEHMNAKQPETLACGCPGTASKTIERNGDECGCTSVDDTSSIPSMLTQWPVQIKLVPVNAPYFSGADLLIAADCTAFAYGDFHKDFIKNKVTIVGCPKLDNVDYAEKLTEILRQNDINSLTVVRMEVPCCGGIVNAVKAALKESGKIIPWQIVTITTDGKIK